MFRRNEFREYLLRFNQSPLSTEPLVAVINPQSCLDVIVAQLDTPIFFFGFGLCGNTRNPCPKCLFPRILSPKLYKRTIWLWLTTAPIHSVQYIGFDVTYHAFVSSRRYRIPPEILWIKQFRDIPLHISFNWSAKNSQTVLTVQFASHY